MPPYVLPRLNLEQVPIPHADFPSLVKLLYVVLVEEKTTLVFSNVLLRCQVTLVITRLIRMVGLSFRLADNRDNKPILRLGVYYQWRLTRGQ